MALRFQINWTCAIYLEYIFLVLSDMAFYVDLIMTLNVIWEFYYKTHKRNFHPPSTNLFFFENLIINVFFSVFLIPERLLG